MKVFIGFLFGWLMAVGIFVVTGNEKDTNTSVDVRTSLEKIKTGEELCKSSGGLSTYKLYKYEYVCSNGTEIKLKSEEVK